MSALLDNWVGPVWRLLMMEPKSSERIKQMRDKEFVQVVKSSLAMLLTGS